jgi:hypothetical protein
MNTKVEDKGSVKDFELLKRNLYVAVFYYPNSPTPFGATSADKNDLIKNMANWSGIDATRPVRIYTLEL